MGGTSLYTAILQTNDPVAQRQLVEIGMFTKDVKYVSAKENLMADWLSRKTDEALIGEAYKLEKNPEMENVRKEELVDFSKMVASTSVAEQLNLHTIKLSDLGNKQKHCPEASNIKKGLHPTSLSFAEVDIDGVPILCETSSDIPRPVVPKEFRQTILKAYHNTDHPGRKESVRRTASNYYWPKIKQETNEYVRTCHACQSTKPSKDKTPHIGDFPVPKKRFSHIHVDVCGPLPPSNGYRYLLTVICRSTRYFDAIPVREASTKACADALLHSWISKFGVSTVCTADNGTEFVSALWKQMQETLGVKMNYTPLYSPQTNGLLERQHQTLKTSLKAALLEMGEKYKDKWYDHGCYL